MMLAYFQDGWMLDWLSKALSPGILFAFVATISATVFAVKVYIKLGALDDMITKKDLDLAIQEMEKSLRQWVDGRFLSRESADAREQEQERIHERQNDDIKYLLQRDRTNRGGVAGAD